MEKGIFIEQERLNKLLNLYEQILVLSIKQMDFLRKIDHNKEKEIDILLQLLDQRQELMNQIDEISGGPGMFQEFGITEQDEIKSIMLAIHKNDAFGQVKLEEQMKSIRAKLISARENQKAYKAYTQEDVYVPAWFFDKKK